MKGFPPSRAPMPIYAFACHHCGHLFDKLQKLSDADPEACPACGTRGSVHRRLTAPQFRLAGGGWYETDFKSEGKRNLAGDGGEAKQAEAKPEPKPASEAKPAATPAPASIPAPKPGPDRA
jgi:putative FmdB family regulatory protein